MNIKNHFLERYIERNIGIKGKKEIKQYLAQNRDQVVNHCQKLCEHAEWVYKGQIGNNTTANFYIKDRFVLLKDANDTCWITFYPVDYGFPDDANLYVAKRLKEEIEQLREKKDKVKQEIDAKKKKIQHEISVLNEEIRLLQATLNEKEKQKDLLERNLEGAMSEVAALEHQIDMHAHRLLNSLAYKEELEKMKEAN